MKKLFTVFISALLLCSLAACGQADEQNSEAAAGGSENALLAYKEEGYTYNSVGTEDNVLKILFTAPDRTDYVQVTVPLTEEEFETYAAMDFFAEDDTQVKDFFSSLSGEMTVIDLNDQVPSDEELSKLVGLTLSDLEAVGYEQTSMADGDDGLIAFIYSDEAVELMIYPEGGYEDLFSLDGVDLAALKIAKVQFYGFQ